jgi:hypothetical protein
MKRKRCANVARAATPYSRFVFSIKKLRASQCPQFFYRNYVCVVKKVFILFRKVLSSCFDDEIDAQAGFIPDFNQAILDNGIGQTFDDLIPPFRPGEWIFKGDEV